MSEYLSAVIAIAICAAAWSWGKWLGNRPPRTSTRDRKSDR